jgi:hypothetical protein
MDTDILNFSYDGHRHVAKKRVRKRTRKRTLPSSHLFNGHGHFTSCVSEYGHAHGHVAHYVFLYGHGHLSLFRVRDSWTFMNIYGHLRHLHIETPSFHLRKDKFRLALRLPLSSPTRELVQHDVRDFHMPMRVGRFTVL